MNNKNGKIININRVWLLNPVYLTANSVKTNKIKLYKNIIFLLKYIFFDLINNSEQIKDKTGI